uniref:Secreted protein n=1 Tax=Anguilla anguilla TaxID=7936 RepID=A0A0E9Q0P6_ANGAN
MALPKTFLVCTCAIQSSTASQEREQCDSFCSVPLPYSFIHPPGRLFFQTYSFFYIWNEFICASRIRLLNLPHFSFTVF